MRNLFYLFLGLATMMCFAACNNEWEDEQYVLQASFKANVNAQGVTTTYVRFNPGGVVKYDLPILMSGSTVNAQNRIIHVGLDPDTLAMLNKEQYGQREELYFRQLPSQYYNMPETVEMPAGQSLTVLPIEFKLDETLDQSDKWVLPLQILESPSNGYQPNPRKYYRRAMLRLLPFNDYSGTYDATQYKCYLEGDKTVPLTTTSTRAFVVDDNTIFIYAGTRDIDYLDRKQYKVFIRFTDEIVDLQTKKLEVWSDNEEIELTTHGVQSYSVSEEMDQLKVYLKKIFITLNLNYSFKDITQIPGQVINYDVEGSLSMLRQLNTLIPDEDQQIQW
ncbi:DUF4973 domain-containing protein [Bacteroides thetaiotaomicron]|uniref:DUF4973 domain-containing protein n=1 Tax=Bacteroides thetaiotaomicron TaxID=818 RepID=UPI0006D56125|nr:DUF4973 domain-containing protein [Bacteroides thetaiotaomicron]